jgi:hypothetical protein
MAARCLVAAADARLHPTGESDVLNGHRRRLLARASGRVLDLSEHWAANLAYYRAGTVATVTVIGDLALGAQLAPSSGVAPPDEAWGLEVVRRDGGIDALEMDSDSVDTLVTTFSLCCIDAIDALFDRVLHWLAPGARVLVLEHVLGTGMIGLLQRALTPVERSMAGGCRLDVNVTGSLRHAGLVTGDCARFRLPVAGPLSVPCVAAVARPRRHPFTGEAP